MGLGDRAWGTGGEGGGGFFLLFRSYSRVTSVVLARGEATG